MNKKQGFTLVELIAIIVILLALSLFVLSFVSKKVEENSNKAFIEEANIFIKGAITKEEVNRIESFGTDDIYHSTIYGKVCYSVRRGLLNQYVEKDGNYTGSVEVCYLDDCEYHIKIWLTDGKRYIDGLTSVTNKDQITDKFTTDYPETCGVRAIGSGTGGDIYTSDFEFTGKEQVMDIHLDGVYALEVWGAQGGDALPSYSGGFGAYAYGEVKLKKGDKLYINVGEKGSDNCPDTDNCKSAYNGGTKGGRNFGGGGGATHIALNSGLFNQVSENLVLVAAGAGSGASSIGCTFDGGNAGGYSAYVPTGSCYSGATCTGRYGTYGGFASNRTDYRGSGAGYGSGSYSYRYGDTPSTYGWGRICGGTSYIGNPKLKNGVMYCFDCAENTSASTRTIQEKNYSEEAISHFSKAGNGYARVKYIENFTEN